MAEVDFMEQHRHLLSCCIVYKNRTPGSRASQLSAEFHSTQFHQSASLNSLMALLINPKCLQSSGSFTIAHTKWRDHNVCQKPLTFTQLVQTIQSTPPPFEFFAQGALAMANRTHVAQMFGSGTYFRVLGVRVNALQIPDVAVLMEEWIRVRGGCHSIAATSMHGIVEAQHDPAFKGILNSADLVVPDGMPLVWLGRRKGHHLPRRVYGPDLMLDFCGKTAGRGYRHFFYGGEPGVPERLAESLQRRFPAMEVCGTISPPFRALDPEEDQEIVSMISRAAPDVLWVGLGTPKQERWMHEHRDKLQVPVLVSVGAAFDFLSRRRKQAPQWMRELGLEWLFRLLQEPGRLWRRYLIDGARFVTYVGLESLGLKPFDPGREPERPSMQSKPPAGSQGASAKVD
jgi:N-acetylglucosaminyldiphosphoundecaprenol N-acetyl-beta-D-mannosaminyltransferase